MGKVALSLAIGVGGALLSAALAPKPKDQYGPRLSDINVASVSPGNPIIRHWGTMKVPGQMLWTSKLIETEHVEEVGGGKKGGGGKHSQKVYTYTYSVDCAVAACQGPIKRINRIWANQKLLWMHEDIQMRASDDFDAAYYAELDRLVNQEGVTRIVEAYCGAFFFAFNNYRPDEYTYGTQAEAVDYIMAHPGTNLTPPIPAPQRSEVDALMGQMLDGLGRDQEYAKNKLRFDAMNIYLGSDTQIPNAKMEEYLGLGNVPAYRGVAYFVLHNLQLEDFGNGIPQFTVEVQRGDGEVFLHEIVTDVCRESGLEDAEFDGIGYLPTDRKVTGFAVTQSMSGRAVLNMLQSVFPFDAAESDYRIIFNWINQRPVAILRREDFGAYAEGSDPPPSVEVTRAQDADLPRRLQIKFQEPARSFSPNMVYATRSVTESDSVDEVDVTMALTRQLAKTQAEEMLALKFTARKTHKVVVPRKYVIIEPGDVVLVPDPADPAGDQYLSWRCVGVDIGANAVLEHTFTDHNQFGHSQAITEDDLDIDDNEPETIPRASPTTPYMLDTPLLSDAATDNVGFYTVLAGNRNSWSGGVLLLDITSGGTIEVFGVEEPNEAAGSKWYAIAQNTVAVAHGYAMTALPDAVPGLWDETMAIRVFLMNNDIALASADPDDVLGQPLNMAVIGNEIVQFCNVREVGNGVWELSKFLRGLRGTEHEIGKHRPGERFVRLKQSAINRVTHDVSGLDRPAEFRAVTFGDDPDSAPSFQFINTGNSLRPFTPAIHELVRRSNDDIYVRWSPRRRQNGGLINGQTLEIDQPFERYEIDVLDGAAVLRTEVVEDREWTYTATMHQSDFGEIRDIVRVRLYQIGQTIGRGFAQELEV
ncbi:phage tail protein [Nitratireductor sp. OM-1]|uniref:phage tail protein n=1 Tax=Nitratireductor sp. OM-1 TaxID=1756988 RepID=UPI000DDFCFD7|nr:phage tail protein [Nitratireductor sp. OM-1]